MKFKYVFFLILIKSTLYADIWVFDINYTITMKNSVDPEKTTEASINKIIAQNVYLKKDPTISLEEYIKKTYPSKKQRRGIYARFYVHLKEFLNQGLISKKTFNNVFRLTQKYKDAVSIGGSVKNAAKSAVESF